MLYLPTITTTNQPNIGNYTMDHTWILWVQNTHTFVLCRCIQHTSYPSSNKSLAVCIFNSYLVNWRRLMQWVHKCTRTPISPYEYQIHASDIWHVYLAILSELFGMVKWPILRVKWPPTEGSRDHFWLTKACRFPPGGKMITLGCHPLVKKQGLIKGLPAITVP